MPTELQIIRASEFVRLDAAGEFDLSASKSALTQLALACRRRNIDCAMLDLRALEVLSRPRFSPTNLAELVNTFYGVAPNRKQRLAVLYNVDPHHRARMFAFIGAREGWNIRAFEDFEHAVLWLSEGAEAGPDGDGAQIPVRLRACPDESKRRS